ncbi:MAG TPA: ATP-binding protein [Candidatus Tectomicrobia bacterium]|nr:ATP-binding protein [Candidatus Tectomicrobia bacterium]
MLEQLREANAQLVLSSLRAHDLAEEARAARAEAEVANRLKDEFLAVVSHELRNPLNAVLGWAQLLGRREMDPERARHALETIQRNARLLARIIDDLLDLSRIVHGGVRIERAPVDLVAVARGALDEMSPAAEAKSVKLTFTCPGMPRPVAGDAIRLQQVIANLLSNAIKFTPAGGRVELTLTQAGPDAVIEVRDTGQGIDASFLPHVFGLFTQADASPARRHGGLGLGLAIVRALVEGHGGSVRADSGGPGQGATFTVRLPMMEQHRSDAGADDSAGTTPPAVRLDGVRVLLVEDDVDGRAMLAMVLEADGAIVVTAGSAGEALATLDTIRPDVMVADIGLPDVDGIALIRQLRARGAEHGGATPAIAFTGYAGAEDHALTLAAGFQAYIQKPVDLDGLIATIASLTGGRST